MTVARSFTQFGMPGSKGEYRLDDHPVAAALRRAGRPLVVADVHADDHTREAAALPHIEVTESRSGIDVPLIKTKRLVGVLSVNHNRPRNWTDEELRLVEAVAERTWAAVGRARAKAELESSELRLGAMLDALPIGVVAEAPSGRVLMDNGAVEAILRHPVLPSADIASHRNWESYHEDGRRADGHEYPNARVLATGEPAEGEYHCRRGDGSMAWVRLIAAPIRDAGGQLVAGVVDIDELKRLTDHQALLMAELSHRMKHALAVVQGIASQTLARATSLGELRQSFEGRLQALSTAHALLLRTNRQALWIPQFVDAVLAPYLSDRLEIEAGPDVQLEAHRG